MPSDVVVTSSSPARTYPIPRDVVEQALQGVRWARAYKTQVPAVHQYTAALLAAGEPVDILEVNRLNRMFVEPDPTGPGWQPGEHGYPCRELILASLAGGAPAQEWTERVLASIEERELAGKNQILDRIEHDPSTYRYVGLCASGDPDIVTDVARTGPLSDDWDIWHPTDGWQQVAYSTVASFDAVEPDETMLAAIVAAISAGDRLLLSYADPVAFLPAVLATTSLPTEVEGAATYAIVDEVDSTAVLDVLRISGESVAVRSGGEWIDEGTTTTWLRNDFPDTLVELDDETARVVLAQVDSIHEPASEAPDGQAELASPESSSVRQVPDLVASIDSVFADVIASIGLEEGDRDEFRRQQDRALLASVGTLHELTTLWARRDLFRTAANGHQRLNPAELPFVAAGGLDRNRGGAETLRRYWTHGKGALKIHWGVKGDWRRCYRQLFKYMGTRAAGYCQLRHKETTGFYTGSRKHGIHASANSEAENGIMVALYPPPELAKELSFVGGEHTDELHVTLAYLGQVDDQDEGPGPLIEAVGQWASVYPPLVGRISGIGRFNAGPGSDEPVVYASVDVPDLPAARQALVEAIDGGSYSVAKDHGFTPHITLCYGDKVDLDSLDIPTIETAFNQVSVVWGSARTDVPFGASASDSTDSTGGGVVDAR